MPTVRDDVGFGPANLGLRGAELAARVASALAAVGMAEHADRPPHHLSFGQRRRVAVATVLAMEPEILVLDEPTSNLDPASRRELADIVRSLDVTTLLVTHDLPFALELCPRSVILSDGRVVADGLTVDLLADEAFLAEHRLELPYGFDPDVHRRRAGAPWRGRRGWPGAGDRAPRSGRETSQTERLPWSADGGAVLEPGMRVLPTDGRRSENVGVWSRV